MGEGGSVGTSRDSGMHGCRCVKNPGGEKLPAGDMSVQWVGKLRVELILELSQLPP